MFDSPRHMSIYVPISPDCIMLVDLTIIYTFEGLLLFLGSKVLFFSFLFNFVYFTDFFNTCMLIVPAAKISWYITRL